MIRICTIIAAVIALSLSLVSAQTICDLEASDCLIKGFPNLQGPPGPQGPIGPAGPIGPQGPAGNGGSGSDVYDVTQYGLKNDLVLVGDGICVNGSTTFQSATANFTPAVVGKSISITLCGLNGPALLTTIAGYVSPTTVTLASPAKNSTTGAVTAFGTDNTPALNALIAATTNGGTLFFPRGNYGFAGKVNIGYVGVYIDGVTLSGDGALIPGQFGQRGPTTLTYLGTGGGSFIDIQSTQYITIQNLMITGLDIHGWTDFMVRVRNNGHGDANQITFDQVYFAIPGGATTSGLLLDTSTEVNIRNSTFNGGKYGLQGLTAGPPSSYANGMQMSGGQFSGQGVAPIFQAGASWSFDHVTFEPTSHGQMVAYQGTPGIPSQNLSFTNCYLTDATVAGVTAFDVYGNGFTLINNQIVGAGTGDNAVLLHGNKGVTILGNVFGGHSNVINYFSPTVQGGIIAGNTYRNIINFEIGTGNKDGSVFVAGNAAF